MDLDDLPDLPEHESAYYLRTGPDTFAPTLNCQGAWNVHEQHMAPVSGLLAHAITSHEARTDVTLARVTFEILGLIPALETTVEVRTIRPGRTIELVEAVASAGGRPVVRAHAWRLSRQDTTTIAGGLPAPLPDPATCLPWTASAMWAGGYIRSIEVVRSPGEHDGAGQAWIRTQLALVDGEEVAPSAAYLGLVDTANGMNTRLDPRDWAFPNIDVSVHLYREPHGGPGEWVGFDTLVTVGEEGVGLTSTTLHDAAGPAGRCEQILTVRPLG
ncbi:MAG TPA: thioesterase family protein [Dermatophilaceae bacterium]|nr:thioesterase family protein [Dermatophilaceae bacterium]